MGIRWCSTSVFTDFKKAHSMVRKEVLYNVLDKFGILMKLFIVDNVFK
jgi:hypothetical protein